VRAQELSKDASAPTPLRRFFRAFGDAVAGHTTSTTTLSSLYKMVHSIKLAKFYEALTREIRKPDGYLRPWLKQQNYRPHKGATWTTVVIQYVTDALGIHLLMKGFPQRVCYVSLVICLLYADFPFKYK
jgi:hypothetical protein